MDDNITMATCSTIEMNSISADTITSSASDPLIKKSTIDLTVDEEENEGVHININKLILVNNVSCQEWKRSTPLKTYSKKSVNTSVAAAVSRYGRSHKPRIADDFLSTDKKVSHYLKIDADNQLHYFKNPYSTYKSPNAKSSISVSSTGSNSQQSTPRKRGRPRKIRSLSESGLSSPRAAQIISVDLEDRAAPAMKFGEKRRRNMANVRPPGTDLNVPTPTSTETLPIPPELMDQVILVAK